MATLTGLVGAIAIHTAIGTLAGRDHIEVLGRRLRFRRTEVGAVRQFLDEAVLIAVLAVVSGPVIALVALGVLNAQADAAVPIAGLCAAGVATIGWFTLFCVTAFGVLGEVLVVLVTTIFGVPSARGVYPAEALPSLFVELGRFLPMRYLTDALRASFYFDARSGAGLTRGLVALGTWAVASLLCGLAVAETVARRRAVTAPGEPTAPDATADGQDEG
jgi:ABC-type polysaccharide/polyol phosphate export permease